jgi:hypothetical protein
MTEATDTNPGRTIIETKYTAAQIEEDCPVMLQDLGKRIAVHSEKAQKCEDKREQHYDSIAHLLATAHRACEEGGFAAFREMFFPNLGKSRVYELLAIGTSKKSVEEIKAGTRLRVSRHRANKAATSNSVTVTENSEPEAPGAPTEAGTVETASIEPDQMPEPTKPRSSVNPGDEALIGFSSVVRRLGQITVNKRAERYAKTSVSADELARSGKFLTDVADLKMLESDVTVPPRDDAVSAADQSAENIKAERPAQDADEVRR